MQTKYHKFSFSYPTTETVKCLDFQIMVEGVRGGDYRSDIAIDDIDIQDRSCSVFPLTASQHKPVATQPPPTLAPVVPVVTTRPNVASGKIGPTLGKRVFLNIFITTTVSHINFVRNYCLTY